MPGDWGSQAWASPFAGANWSPMPLGATDERVRRWEKTILLEAHRQCCEVHREGFSTTGYGK
ncbi:hypothetical protein DFH29DRAFT_610940 [Suillus ampliporus]|nr:hypothetical protein DFH29DRAFT_610940 [Suillus ampliporus]